MIEPTTAVLISVAWILLMLVLGMPVWVTLFSAGLLGLMMVEGLDMALAQLKTMPYVHTAEYTLLVVPMFILMGHLAFAAGLSHNAYRVGRMWFSRFPAGLGLATILGCGAFAGACGSSVATAATMGRVAIPEMNALGYDKKLSAGTVAAGGVLGILIPPSIILVFYGTLTETSVGGMLVGGVIPGLLTMAVFMLGLIWLSWRNPSLCPAPESYTWKERFQSLKYFWGIVVLFIIVMGGIWGGIATPSESAGLGAFASMIMMIMANKGSWNDIMAKVSEALRETVHTCAMIFLILLGSYMYSFFITLCGVPEEINQWVAGLPLPPFAIVVMFLLFLIPLGCFLDPFSILVITLPISHPVVVETLGYNSIWFGILCTKLIEIGCITPPVGLNVFVIAGIARDVPMQDIFKGSLWFVLFEAVTIALLMLFPFLSYWLPDNMPGI
ncbi:MAG: TRAP transporter large permease [Desulfarculaceae bacterium]|nr:TRAP transporter large permease [Desulfarculaceae bacterium]MCF8072440.1 TRAP transporter large permease [Desulfarculaceae bacterium]MCF8102901.1 TRAP transporter large permease [Desulfarculaceae bacterium]MCF8118483.1 TRAP transporter large permease [Desulfarculaceae bacterium]